MVSMFINAAHWLACNSLLLWLDDELSRLSLFGTLLLRRVDAGCCWAAYSWRAASAATCHRNVCYFVPPSLRHSGSRCARRASSAAQHTIPHTGIPAVQVAVLPAIRYAALRTGCVLRVVRRCLLPFVLMCGCLFRACARSSLLACVLPPILASTFALLLPLVTSVIGGDNAERIRCWDVTAPPFGANGRAY